MEVRRAARHAAALAAYAALAVLFCRPVWTQFSTAYLGPGGDASVTIWNSWYFRYCLTVLHSDPMRTRFLYWPAESSLLLHQYTLLYDAFALLAGRWLGDPAVYNLHLLLSFALAGDVLFLMARDWGASDGAAFVAGALFAFAPFVSGVVDSGDGVCFQILWPCALFVWALSRAARDGRVRDAALAAVALTIQWAYSYYYFLFCALLIPFFFAWLQRPLDVGARRRATPRALTAATGIALALAGGWALLALARGQREFHGRGSAAALLAYVAPYLSVWAATGLALAVRYAPAWRWNPRAWTRRALFPYAAVATAWLVLNLPLIVATVRLMRSGGYGATPAAWRGGGNPTDPIWLLLPDPGHPLWGRALRRLYDAAGLGVQESRSLGVVPLAGLLWLWRRGARDRWVSLWWAGLAFSALITMGPWLKLFGVHLYLPLPFYALHLLPVFSNLQHGMRFIAFITLFLALLSAAALDQLRARLPEALRPWVCPLAFALVALEYAPPARAFFRLEVPPVVARLAARPDGALLTIPVGANFNGLSGSGWSGHMLLDQALQPVYHRPIVGGYLGRVSRRTYERFVGDAFLSALIAAQDGAPPGPVLTDPGRAARSLRDLRLRYVLADDRLPPALNAAVARWPLRRVDREGRLTLYEVAADGKAGLAMRRATCYTFH